MASHSPCAIINFFECCVRRAATNICTPPEETGCVRVCTIFAAFFFGFASMTLVTRLQTFYTATTANANANTIFRSFHVLTFISANILFGKKNKKKTKVVKGKTTFRHYSNFNPLVKFLHSTFIRSCSPKMRTTT